MGTWPKRKRERRRRAAPRSPAKGTQERTLAAAPLRGRGTEYRFLRTQGPCGPGWPFSGRQYADAHASVRVVNGPGPARSMLWSVSPWTKAGRGLGTMPKLITGRCYATGGQVSRKKAAWRGQVGTAAMGRPARVACAFIEGVGAKMHGGGRCGQLRTSRRRRRVRRRCIRKTGRHRVLTAVTFSRNKDLWQPGGRYGILAYNGFQGLTTSPKAFPSRFRTWNPNSPSTRRPTQRPRPSPRRTSSQVGSAFEVQRA
jgi:hypothetical protein